MRRHAAVRPTVCMASTYGGALPPPELAAQMAEAALCPNLATFAVE